MHWYAAAKLLHVVCAVSSIGGFIARWILAARGSALLRHPIARFAPHVNDTLLLGAAVVMLATAGIDPLDSPWLQAKLVGLLAYIVLGMVSLRYRGSWRVRALAFAAALAAFAYIATVAITKSPLGAAAWLAVP